MGIISPEDVWYPATAEDADAAAEEDDGHIPPPIRFVDDSKSWPAAVGGWNRAARTVAAALGAALLVAEAADLRARMPAVRESMVAGSFVCLSPKLQKSRSFSIDAPGFRGTPKLARTRRRKQT